MPDSRDEYRKEWNKELQDQQMPKCPGCGCDLDDNNTNYSEIMCDDCYEENEEDEEEEFDEEEFDRNDP